MKNLIQNIWKGPASTVAGAITAGLTFVLAAEVELPTPALVTIGALSAFLSFFAGPQKKKP